LKEREDDGYYANKTGGNEGREAGEGWMRRYVQEVEGDVWIQERKEKTSV